MDIELEQIYPWGALPAETGDWGFTVCSEAPGAWSGEFALVVLLAQALRNNAEGKCIVVCINKDKNHYEVILKRQVIIICRIERIV